MTRRTLPRALSVLAMCAGFYVLALMILGSLFWLPWAQVHYEHRLGPAGVLCAIVGCWLLYALLPRGTRFEAPGPALADGEHPALQKLVGEVAQQVGEKAPDDIYLVPEATAFTGNRRVGLRRRRIVGLGLPLLSALSRSELAAVIAHELGHHHGGDLRLTAWLVETRRALSRTLEDLDDSILWLHLPFIWYARWFLRATFKLSREQEFAADALAASLIGHQPTAAALRKIHELGPQWTVYWAQEVLPLLSAGRRPPLRDGFRIFQREAANHAALGEAFRNARERATSAHDTHPSLADRLAALVALAPGTARLDASDELATEESRTGASQLLDPALDVEERTLAAVVRPDALRELKPLSWEQVASELWLPGWRKTLAPFSAALLTLRIEDLHDVLHRDCVLWAQRLRSGLALLSPEAERRRLVGVMGTWLAVELVDAHRFEIDTLPGRPVYAVRDAQVLEPHQLVKRLSDNELTAGDLRALCAAIRESGTAPAVTDAEITA